MSKGIGCAVVVVIVLVILGLALAGTYNRLVGLSQAVDAQWAQVESVYQRRADLIPNLVATVQGAANFEKSTLEAVTKARNAAVAASTPQAQAQAENMLSGALRQLFALSESYPDLKASTNFLQLQSDLSDLENKIAASRRFLNNAVQEYNASIQQFPAVLLAGPLGFTAQTFFELDEGERAAVNTAPQVKF